MPEAPAPEQTAETQLGEFSIESVLGEGGSGTVYAARWGHRQVALKVLRESILPSDSERRHFLDEAQLLADVNHPGVVRILGFGELPDGRPYLAMERLEGESLGSRLQRGPIPVERALPLFDQLAQAVQTLHDRGLIHRDIKPENVFLVRGEQYAVLLDFGIAKTLDAPDSTVTREGGVRGTPAYMAPERFFGASASAATDIYELAVVLFTMLTGQLPWEQSSDPVTRLNPRRPSSLGVPLPGALEDRLLAALSSRGENRPGTVRDFAQQVVESIHEAPRAGARRTADLPTAPQAMTVPGKAADPATAPTLAVTPQLAAAPSPLVGMDTTSPNVITGPRGATVPAAGLPARAEPTPSRGHGRGRTLALLGALLLVVGVIATITVLKLRRSGAPASPAGTTHTSGPPRNDASVRKRKPPVGPDKLVWKLHPADTKVLLRVDVSQLKTSPVFRAIVAGGKGVDKISYLAVLKKACNIDLLEQLEWVSVGISGPDKNPDFDAALRGGWTRAAVESCIAKLGKLGEVASSVKREGRISRVKFATSSFWIAWPDDKTFFISSRNAATRAWIEDRLAGKSPARSSTALWTVYEELKQKTSVWVAAAAPDWMTGEFVKGLPSPNRGGLSVHCAQDLQLQAQVVFQDAKAALAARDAVQLKLQKLKNNTYLNMLLTKAEVGGKGSDVILTIYLDNSSALLFAKAVAAYLGSTDWKGLTTDSDKSAGAPGKK
ncbi:MAG: protein kinase [bacterium]